MVAYGFGKSLALSLVAPSVLFLLKPAVAQNAITSGSSAVASNVTHQASPSTGSATQPDCTYRIQVMADTQMPDKVRGVFVGSGVSKACFDLLHITSDIDRGDLLQKAAGCVDNVKVQTASHRYELELPSSCAREGEPPTSLPAYGSIVAYSKAASPAGPGQVGSQSLP